MSVWHSPQKRGGADLAPMGVQQALPQGSAKSEDDDMHIMKPDF